MARRSLNVEAFQRTILGAGNRALPNPHHTTKPRNTEKEKCHRPNQPSPPPGFERGLNLQTPPRYNDCSREEAYQNERALKQDPGYPRDRIPEPGSGYPRDRAREPSPGYPRERALEPSPGYPRDRAPEPGPGYPRDRAPEQRLGYQTDKVPEPETRCQRYQSPELDNHERPPEPNPRYQSGRFPAPDPGYPQGRFSGLNPRYERHRIPGPDNGYPRDRFPEPNSGYPRDRLPEPDPSYQSNRVSDSEANTGYHLDRAPEPGPGYHRDRAPEPGPGYHRDRAPEPGPVYPRDQEEFHPELRYQESTDSNDLHGRDNSLILVSRPLSEKGRSGSECDGAKRGSIPVGMEEREMNFGAASGRNKEMNFEILAESLTEMSASSGERSRLARHRSFEEPRPVVSEERRERGVRRSFSQPLDGYQLFSEEKVGRCIEEMIERNRGSAALRDPSPCSSVNSSTTSPAHKRPKSGLNVHCDEFVPSCPPPSARSTGPPPRPSPTPTPLLGRTGGSWDNVPPGSRPTMTSSVSPGAMSWPNLPLVPGLARSCYQQQQFYPASSWNFPPPNSFYPPVNQYSPPTAMDQSQLSIAQSRSFMDPSMEPHMNLPLLPMRAEQFRPERDWSRPPTPIDYSRSRPVIDHSRPPTLMAHSRAPTPMDHSRAPVEQYRSPMIQYYQTGPPPDQLAREEILPAQSEPRNPYLSTDPPGTHPLCQQQSLQERISPRPPPPFIGPEIPFSRGRGRARPAPGPPSPSISAPPGLEPPPSLVRPRSSVPRDEDTPAPRAPYNSYAAELARIASMEDSFVGSVPQGIEAPDPAYEGRNTLSANEGRDKEETPPSSNEREERSRDHLPRDRMVVTRVDSNEGNNEAENWNSHIIIETSPPSATTTTTPALSTADPSFAAAITRHHSNMPAARLPRPSHSAGGHSSVLSGRHPSMMKKRLRSGAIPNSYRARLSSVAASATPYQRPSAPSTPSGTIPTFTELSGVGRGAEFSLIPLPSVVSRERERGRASSPYIHMVNRHGGGPRPRGSGSSGPRYSGGGGGGGRRSTGSPQPRSVRISKMLSAVCRHRNLGADKLEMLPGGYFYLDEVLSLSAFTQLSVTEEEMEGLIHGNDKQRFAVDERQGRKVVRANQGHSVEVDSLALTPILTADEEPCVVHGTYEDAWQHIRDQGLSKMRRTHIHFARGLPKDRQVISGMRSNCQLAIYVDLERALSDGYKFFRSANGVILCPGDERGYLPAAYFSSVKRLPSGQELISEVKHAVK